jgi:V8-like Glu-specific endopeptidase
MLVNAKSLLCAATLALAASPALAITAGGELDGNAHPYVGLMIAKDAAGTPLWRCSGTLLSPTVFLTAGHCTESPAVTAELWFDADMQTNAAAKGYPYNGQASGTTYTHPQYNPNAFYLYDLGVVVLNKPVVKSQYGALPALNELDAMATARGLKNQTFTAVGYGLQQINPVFVSALKIRMYATPHLIQINTGFTGPQSILLSNNHSTGGTCFGDSGGPNFIGKTNVVGGVTSFGINGNCAGTGGVYRVDQEDDLAWVASFL